MSTSPSWSAIRHRPRTGRLQSGGREHEGHYDHEGRRARAVGLCAGRARIEEALALAEAHSSFTCQLCGAEGEKYHKDEITKVRCEAHTEGRPLAEARANARLHPIRVVVPSTPRVVTVRRYDRHADAFVGPLEDMMAAPPGGAEPKEN